MPRYLRSPVANSVRGLVHVLQLALAVGSSWPGRAARDEKVSARPEGSTIQLEVMKLNEVSLT